MSIFRLKAFFIQKVYHLSNIPRSSFWSRIWIFRLTMFEIFCSWLLFFPHWMMHMPIWRSSTSVKCIDSVGRNIPGVLLLFSRFMTWDNFIHILIDCYSIDSIIYDSTVSIFYSMTEKYKKMVILLLNKTKIEKENKIISSFWTIISSKGNSFANINKSKSNGKSKKKILVWPLKEKVIINLIH